MKNDNEYLEPEIDSGKEKEIIDGFPDDEITDAVRGFEYYIRNREKMFPSMDDVRAYEEARACNKPNYLIAILPGQYRAEIQLETEYPADDKGMTL